MIAIGRRIQGLQHAINSLLTEQRHSSQQQRQELHRMRNQLLTKRNKLIHSIDPEAIL